MHKLKIEFSKFTMVGAINFVFTLVMFFWLVKIVEFNYLSSLILVSFLGMVLTYSLNYIWVFKPEKKFEMRGRFIKYLLSGSLSIALNVLTLKYLVDQTGYDPFYLQMALIPFIVVVNFSAAKYWSLRRVEME